LETLLIDDDADDLGLCRPSRKACQETLKVWTPDKYPLDFARAQLFAAIGLAPADAAELTLVAPEARLNAARAKTPGSLLVLLPQAQTHRPEVAQQAHLVLAADRQTSARGFALLPDIDLEGAYLRTDGQPFQPKNAAFVGLKASWAIWEWGASDLQRKAALPVMQRAAELLPGVVGNLLVDILGAGAFEVLLRFLNGGG